MKPRYSKNILVVANGEPPSFELLSRLLKKHDQLVAVDGGLNTCLQYGLEPHLIIGDFDSISEETLKSTSYIPQIHTPDQNKSDLEKTLEYLLQSPVESITVCGATGRRIDHTLTNICLLSRYPDKVKFETDTESCFALPKSSFLTCKKGTTLSLIAASTEVMGVHTTGLKWDLKGDTLGKHFFSISNVCLETTVSISFTSGDLLVSLLHGSGCKDERAS